MEKYQIEKVLAPALFGQVLLCRELKTNQNVAVKRLHQQAAYDQLTIKGKKRVLENIELEKQTNEALSKNGGHPHVLHMQNSFVQRGYDHLVFEYCSKGELFEILESSLEQKFSNDRTLKYFREILHGVQFMHSRGFAHRDLSLENVLVNEFDQCKICDFGLAAAISSGLRTESVGKNYYMAPEVQQGIAYCVKKADVWSLGIMLFIMLAGVPPFEIANERDARFRVVQKYGIRKLIEHWQLEMDPNVIDLLEQMVECDVNRRFQLDQVMCHEYIFVGIMAIENQFRHVQIGGSNNHSTISQNNKDEKTQQSSAKTNSTMLNSVMNTLKRRPRSFRKIIAVPLHDAQTASAKAVT